MIALHATPAYVAQVNAPQDHEFQVGMRLVKAFVKKYSSAKPTSH